MTDALQADPTESWCWYWKTYEGNTYCSLPGEVSKALESQWTLHLVGDKSQFSHDFQMSGAPLSLSRDSVTYNLEGLSSTDKDGLYGVLLRAPARFKEYDLGVRLFSVCDLTSTDLL